jgi:hypothetical protein
MAVAGINILVFYGTGVFEEMRSLPAGVSVPLRTKLIGGISLPMWIAVLLRPPPDRCSAAAFPLILQAFRPAICGRRRKEMAGSARKDGPTCK